MSTSTAAFAAVAVGALALIGVRRAGQNAKKRLTKLRFDYSAKKIAAMAAELIKYMTDVHDEIAAVAPEAASWDNTLGRMMRLEEEVDAWVNNLVFPKYVSTSKAVRDASTAAASELSRHHVTLSMRMDVYTAVKAYADTNPTLEGERKRYLEHAMRDYRRLGMTLDDDTRGKIEALKKEVKKLETSYSQNLAEEDRKCYFTKEELAGLPAGLVGSLKQEGGKYELTMAYPHVLPVLDRCSVPTTREQILVAFQQRAIGTNVEIMEKLVVLRCQIAKLLGYATHADYRLEVEMAKSPSKVLPFLKGLVKGLTPLITEELAALRGIKKADEGSDDFKAWDLRYYLRKRKEAEYKIDEQEVMEYFPMEVVTAGMLDIYQKLLGLQFAPVKNPHVWHPEVTMYSVTDVETKELMGYFYLDLFPRAGKYGHACCVPSQKGYGFNEDGTRKSVACAAMLANFTKPTADTPSLLRHGEVVTFFHEFGHVMHHICSHTENACFASFDVEGDFVEAPSQMLENWCWQAETLKLMSGHYKDTSKKLPDAMAASLAASKEAHVGILTRRQLLFGIFDQTLHGITDAEPVDTAKLLEKLHAEIMMMPMAEGTNFAASFGHLAGGYDAKYYGYMFSETFSMDMFRTRFLAEGLLNPKTGMAYRREILQPGGSRDAMDSLTKFLGRPPNMKAFLKSKGLSADAASL